MYYCALSLWVLQHILPRFLVTCAFWCDLEYSFRELSLEIWYCFGLAICTGACSNTILGYNSVHFGVCMIKLRHERMLILRYILPPPKKTELSP